MSPRIRNLALFFSFLLFFSRPTPLAAGVGDPNLEVDFKWSEVEGATHYVVIIARDPSFQRVITTIDSSQLKARSQPIPPGVYFWTVDAFNDVFHLNRLPPRAVVVGAPYRVDSESNPRLPAPHTLSPPQLYPPVSNIRLAWSPVPGAKQYIFRLWNEDHKILQSHVKKETHLRWETTLDHPWIVLMDAPYTSFMYLDHGHYRWEVAGVNSEKQQVGNFATGKFEVHKKFFFKPDETELAGAIVTSPIIYARHGSATSDVNYRRRTRPLGGAGYLNWWTSYEYGARVSGEMTAVLRSHTMRKAAIEARFRRKLTNAPNGWHFELGAGLQFLQVPHAEYSTFTNLETLDFVSTLGPVVDFSFVHRFKSNHSAILGFRLARPSWIVAREGEGGDIRRAIDLRFINEWRWHTSQTAFLFGSVEFFHNEVFYQPSRISVNLMITRYTGPMIRFGLGLSL